MRFYSYEGSIEDRTQGNDSCNYGGVSVIPFLFLTIFYLSILLERKGWIVVGRSKTCSYFLFLLIIIDGGGFSCDVLHILGGKDY